MSSIPLPSELGTRPRLVDFTDRFVQPPSAVYVTVDDQLTFRYASKAAGAQARLGIRYLHPTEGILYWRQDLETTAARVIAVRQDPGIEGFLLGINVELVSAPAGNDWNFASVQLGRDPGGFGGDFHALAQGYFTANEPLIWPGGYYRNAWDGRGTPVILVGVDPAAGANWSQAVPDGARWRVMTIGFRFSTSAAVANRRVIVQVNDPVGNRLFSVASNSVQQASLTEDYSVGEFGDSLAAASAQTRLVWPMDTVLPAGCTIFSAIQNLQGADNSTAPVFLVEEWFFQ